MSDDVGTLVVTRNRGESVQIGEDVTVTVLGAKGNHIRIGITAPKKVTVYRKEIWDSIKSEEAAKAAQGKEEPKG